MIIANPCPSKYAAMLTHASGKTMLTCKCIQALVKIYHVVQELCAFSLIADGQADRLAQWGRAMYTNCLPCQKDYEGFKLDLVSYFIYCWS